MKIALLGQPNTGKSSFFNRVAGVKARTSNLPGTTVRVHESPIRVDGDEILLVDLPGTYSLTPLDPAQAEVLSYLIKGDISGLIIVLDATALARSLELAIEAAELGIPMVLALNFWDQVPRKGIEIDADRLSEIMGAKALACSALHGKGIPEILREAVSAAKAGSPPEPLRYSSDVESTIAKVERRIPGRFGAIKAIEGLEGPFGSLDEETRNAIRELESSRGRPGWEIMAAERHHLAMRTAERITSRLSERPSLSSRVDRFVLHPLWGSLTALLVFGFFFWAIFYLGRLIEGLTLAPLEALFSNIVAPIQGKLLGAIASAALDAILGTLGIVFPYFIPLIFFMAIAEDLGYLPRVAHMTDGLLHRMGLHGKAVIPFILGYGCSVPAVAAVRIMESRRDRVLTGILAPLIPCSARTTIILGLVGYFLGGFWALAIYILNILVIGVIGTLLSRLRGGESWGMVMEIPPYRLPTLRSVCLNVWLQLKEFLAVAFPLLILGSVLLGLLDYWNIKGLIDFALSPFVSGLLGLPKELGAPLVFGFLKKELALIMAATALSVSPANINTALSPIQIMVYTVFAVFYVPCLATTLMTWRELSWKPALGAAGLSLAVATIMALVIRALGAVLSL